MAGAMRASLQYVLAKWQTPLLFFKSLLQNNHFRQKKVGLVYEYIRNLK